MITTGSIKNIEKPKVGQFVYLLSPGYMPNAATAGPEQLVVARVGREYFYVCRAGQEDCFTRHTSFRVRAWGLASGGACIQRVYPDIDSWAYGAEMQAANKAIRDAFISGRNDLSLDQLRRIVAIIEEGEG